MILKLKGVCDFTKKSETRDQLKHQQGDDINSSVIPPPVYIKDQFDVMAPRATQRILRIMLGQTALIMNQVLENCQ